MSVRRERLSVLTSSQLGQWQRRDSEFRRGKIMARCPGSAKVRATVASAIQGFTSEGLSRRRGDARTERLLAKCLRQPWTGPDIGHDAGQQNEQMGD